VALVPRQPVDVVFVHGVLSSHEVWDDFIRLIDRDPELNYFVKTHRFQYESRLTELRWTRRIADIDDLADLLSVYLTTELAGDRLLVLVTHSMGGLIVQRYLARTLARGGGQDLRRIKRILMYACPNSGSEFLLQARKRLIRIPNPQELALRPLNRQITETQQAVLRDVVNAEGYTQNKCHIPIFAYGAANDNIVKPYVAKGAFPDAAVVDGDHFTIVQPKSTDAMSYRVLATALITVADHDDDTTVSQAEASAEPGGRVSVAPPFGRIEGELQGRDELIGAIMSSARSRVHVLAGLGGSGKSRLALEIADRARQAGRRVWWVSVTRVNGCMQEVASQLGIPESRVELAWRDIGSAPDLVWRFLEEQTRPWLLIFDNADDPGQLAPLNAPVSDGTGWLRSPVSGKGMVIVTSRNRSQATWGSWCEMHSVPPLEVADGAAMLMTLVNPGGGSMEQARSLSAELGGLPLALKAAADYVNWVGSAQSVYSGETPIRDLGDYREAVARRFNSPPGTSGSGLSETLGLEIVQTVFNLSLDLLASSGLPEAAPLLKLFACLNIAPIPYSRLLADDVLAGSPLFPDHTPTRRRPVLEGLSGLGLIDLSVMSGIDEASMSRVLTLHPAVHGVLRDDPDVRRRRTAYYSLNIRLLLSVTQDRDPDLAENWEIWHIIIPHAVEVTRSALLGAPGLRDPRVILSALELARLTSRYLIVAGLIQVASDLVLPIIADCSSFGLSPDDREILALRHEKGRISLERGDPADAETELKQVVARRTRLLGERDPDLLASRHKLAKAILEQGRWAEAEGLLASIVHDEHYVRGPEHSDTMVVRHSLARAIFNQGRIEEAERMLRDILLVRYRLWSPTTPETLFVRQTLARCLLEQDRSADALSEVENALSEVPERLDEPVVMQLRHTLGAALLSLGRVQEALTTYIGLMDDRTRVLGPTHPETLRTGGDLAKVERIDSGHGE
jgi:pimeloyl-ACP methyl ester carboxylesterase/tetratricopeptide (TPR) repeat protein